MYARQGKGWGQTLTTGSQVINHHLPGEWRAAKTEDLDWIVHGLMLDTYLLMRGGVRECGNPWCHVDTNILVKNEETPGSQQ